MNPETCPSCHQPLPANAPAGLCPACVMRAAFASGPAATGPSVTELQAAFPQLEILECIGRGGMGIVYKARQPHLDRFVALKILAPGLQADPGFAERFTREARTLAKLTHPNLVAVHDFGESGGFYYLLMEYVDGVNLRQAMRAARFTPEQALGLIPDLCAALQFAHDHGVLHRDIKPENILIDTKGRVKIADFGIARLLAEDPQDLALTLTGAALGSAAYMAPEQIEHPEDVDHRADIYSLGVVFYEMLTGGLPLGRFPAPSEKSTSDPRLDEVVFRALEKERDRRYQSATDVRVGVEGHTSGARVVPLKAAQENGLPVLPAYVKWPQVLMIGGLFLALAVAQVSPDGLVIYWWKKLTLRGQDEVWEFTATQSLLYLLMIFACFAVAAGQVWGIWNLNLMRRGKLPLAGRKLLIVETVWLLVLLTMTGVFVWLSGWPDKALGEGIRHWLVLIAFGIVYGVARALFGLTDLRSPDPVPRWRRITMAVAALALLAGAGIMTKQISGNWNERGYRPGTLSIAIPAAGEDKDQVERLVRAAAVTAAGDYLEQIRPTYDGGVLRATFLYDPQNLALAPDSGKGFREMRSSWTHALAFNQRFRASLPVAISWRITSEDWDMDGWMRMRRESAPKHVVIILMTVTAALLTARCGFRYGMIPFGGGLVFAGVLYWLPVPPLAPEFQQQVISGPEMPPIPPSAYDFSTPEAAIGSIYKAAAKGDVAAFKRGFSKATLLKAGASFDSGIEKVDKGTFIRVESSTGNSARIRMMRADGQDVPLNMVLEDEGWRIDR